MSPAELLEDIDDALYSIKRYQNVFGKWPNILQPKTFNEYILRKKLFDRSPLLTQIADKYAMRTYVTERIGIDHLPKLYQVTKEPTQLDFAKLPDCFVVKATHGCGYNLLVQDKNTILPDKIIQQCQEWLSQNYYKRGREWCYKHISPQIIVEELLQTAEGKTPTEYKISCFNGKPKYIAAHIDRHTNHRQALYNLDWEQVPMRYKYQDDVLEMARPINLDEMLMVAAKLAHGLDYVRVDLYNDGDRITVGELTNYPNNGYSRFIPEKYDFELGDAWSSAKSNQIN